MRKKIIRNPIASNKVKTWLNKTKGNYTRQVEKPEEFLRFDLTEGFCWFENLIEEWKKQIPIDTVIHYPNAACVRQKKLLSRWLHVRPENIAVGNGSDEFIDLIAQIFLNPKDKALMPIPSFFRFAEATKKAGAEVVTVRFSEEDGFEWSKRATEKFLAKASDPEIKLIWLASPNNPTGVTIPEPILKKIINTGKLVVLDKVLNGFAKELRGISKHIWEHPNLIVLSSFSKTFGLPGLRFGFVIASSKKTSLLEQWKLPFTVSGPTLWLVGKLLEDLISKNIKVPSSNNFHKKKACLESELEKVSCVKVVSKSKTNFLLIKPLKNIGLFDELRNQKILVADLEKTPGLENGGFIRVTIRSEDDNKALTRALKSINANLNSQKE